MKNYIGYRANGWIVFATQLPGIYDFKAPDGMTVIEVDADTYAAIAPTVGQLKFRVVDGAFVQIHEKPSAYHELDWTTYEWRLNKSLADADIRAKRSRLLAATDWTDTISAKERMSVPEFAAWATYRQALRDITNQTGFPLTVDWPVAPNNFQGTTA